MRHVAYDYFDKLLISSRVKGIKSEALLCSLCKLSPVTSPRGSRVLLLRRVPGEGDSSNPPHAQLFSIIPIGLPCIFFCNLIVIWNDLLIDRRRQLEAGETMAPLVIITDWCQAHIFHNSLFIWQPSAAAQSLRWARGCHRRDILVTLRQEKLTYCVVNCSGFTAMQNIVR